MRLSTRSFALADYGKVLSTRNVGRKVAEHIDRLVADENWRDFALDFTGVEIVTPTFLDEVLRSLYGLNGVVMVLVGDNLDVHEVISLVRSKHAERGIS